jgi:hypothetical protein
VFAWWKKMQDLIINDINSFLCFYYHQHHHLSQSELNVYHLKYYLYNV